MNRLDPETTVFQSSDEQSRVHRSIEINGRCFCVVVNSDFTDTFYVLECRPHQGGAGVASVHPRDIKSDGRGFDDTEGRREILERFGRAGAQDEGH